MIGRGRRRVINVRRDGEYLAASLALHGVADVCSANAANVALQFEQTTATRGTGAAVRDEASDAWLGGTSEEEVVGLLRGELLVDVFMIAWTRNGDGDVIGRAVMCKSHTITILNAHF